MFPSNLLTKILTNLMKKMGFNKSGWLSFLRQSLSLALFFCFAGLQSGQAQVAVKFTASDTTSIAHKLDACNGDVTSSSTRFTDDGTNDGNYADPVGHERRDTVEFCPKDQWHRVKVVFTDFDLEKEDTLLVFDGNRAAVRANAGQIGCGSGTGVGVANAFGGWKDASCSPSVNPSGCLTFVLKTDGMNTKGSGWDAWVDCEERDVKLTPIDVTDTRLACDETVARKDFLAPYVVACGDTLANSQDSVRMVVKNQHGVICIDTCIGRNQGNNGFHSTFAIGQYLVEATLKADPTKKTSKRFAIQAPSLVANDDINVPLGSACMVALTPDDLLEQKCDTIAGAMYYNITVTLGTGKDTVVLRTTGHNNLGAVTYPVITREDLKAAKATVKIARTYYGDRDGDGNADIPAPLTPSNTPKTVNNGAQMVMATTRLVFSDIDAPWVDVTKAPTTIIACGPDGLAKFFAGSGVDNCDEDIDVDIKVTLDETDPCFNANGRPDTTIARILFTAVDECGNVGTAVRVATIIRPDVENANIVVKSANVKVECSADAATIPYPGVKTGVWNGTNFTSASTTDTTYLNDKEYICGYILVQSEETIPATDCGKKKYVYWDALDWCTSTEGTGELKTKLTGLS